MGTTLDPELRSRLIEVGAEALFRLEGRFPGWEWAHLLPDDQDCYREDAAAVVDALGIATRGTINYVGPYTRFVQLFTIAAAEDPLA